MSRSLRLFFWSVLGISAAFTMPVGSAFATVADYNSFVQSYGDTIICYDFEGTTPTENKAGTTNAALNDLVEVTLRDGGGTGNITYTPGFDGTSTAFKPYNEDYYLGKMFSTGNPLPLSTTVSYEAIVCRNSSESSYITSSYLKENNITYRGYFTAQYGTEMCVRFGGGEGANFNSGAFSIGDWCYLALTASYDDSSNSTAYTLYSANLTGGDTTLSSISGTASGSFLTGKTYGIGALSVNGLTTNVYYQEATDAQIDQVVFYDGVQNAAFFQDNLDRILATSEVPEPSTAMLLIAGGLALGLVRRRG